MDDCPSKPTPAQATKIATLEFELKAARYELEIADGEIDRLQALRATSQTPDAVREALKPFSEIARSIPDDLPDDMWTSCSSYEYDMPQAAFDQLIAKGVPLRSRKTKLQLWIDGISLVDFRRAKAAFSTPSASAGPPQQADIGAGMTRGHGGAPFDPTNHHNALKCPYCNPQGLAFAQPQQADGATEINIEGIIGDCVSIDALPWKNDDGSPTLLNRIIGIHEAANQIRAALQQSPATDAKS